MAEYYLVAVELPRGNLLRPVYEPVDAVSDEAARAAAVSKADYWHCKDRRVVSVRVFDGENRLIAAVATPSLILCEYMDGPGEGGRYCDKPARYRLHGAGGIVYDACVEHLLVEADRRRLYQGGFLTYIEDIADNRRLHPVTLDPLSR